MTAWSMARSMGWSTKAVVAAALLAVLLVASVPLALCVGLVLTLLGHVVVGLALFGASILAAAAAVVIAGLSGVRHLRKMISRQGFGGQGFGRQGFGRQGFRVVQLGRGDYEDYR